MERKDDGNLERLLRQSAAMIQDLEIGECARLSTPHENGHLRLFIGREHHEGRIVHRVTAIAEDMDGSKRLWQSEGVGRLWRQVWANDACWWQFLNALNGVKSLPWFPVEGLGTGRIHLRRDLTVRSGLDMAEVAHAP